jgi:hypothetical protein
MGLYGVIRRTALGLERLERMREHGNGIALVFARTDTKAMQSALHAADAVFFLAGRLTFLRSLPPFEPGDQNAGAPSLLLGYGKTAADRLEALSETRSGMFYRNSNAEENAS